MGRKGLFDRLIDSFKKGRYQGKRHIPRPYKPRKIYSVQDKLQIIKELEESGTPISVFAKWKGIPANTIQNWQNAYKTQGEKGLENKTRRLDQTLPPEAVDKIVKLKTEHPDMGSHRIADWLFRHDFVKVSHNAILNLLKKRPETKDLIEEPTVPKNPKPYEPQRFERSKPRQMYQMDITNWHLKGLYNVYIIACLDDYSRYIAGWGIFRRQTSEHCIDVLRSAIEQFNSIPEEMLTDNGRQFYTWRGKSDFQKYLMKMGIKHIRSRPYHPQTLGKIESFWRNMYQELLSRETITSYEDLELKMRKYIDHYNFKRPHQGIDGLVPADRFFGVDKQIKEAMLEGAGMVKDALVLDPHRLTRPMYLIGRIGDKEIRVMAKDGSVIVQGVDSIQEKSLQPEAQDVDLSLNKGENNDGNIQQIPPSDTAPRQAQCSEIGLEQGKNGQPDMPSDGYKQGNISPVGEEGPEPDGPGADAGQTGQASQGLHSAAGDGQRDKTASADQSAPDQAEPPAPEE
jgi:transposase InsO family protein